MSFLDAYEERLTRAAERNALDELAEWCLAEARAASQGDSLEAAGRAQAYARVAARIRQGR